MSILHSLPAPARIARLAHQGLSELGAGALELLWPTRCVGCDAPLTLLCDECRSRLPVIDQALACPRCGAPFGHLVCTECSDSRERGRDGDSAWEQTNEHMPDVFSSLAGVACYGVLAWPLDSAIRVYKDAGERRLAPLLAAMIACGVRESEPRGFPLAALSGVTFVPATPAAFARRGFDHMEDIARCLARELGLPMIDALARQKRTDQRELGREQRLAASATGWRVVADVRGMHLLLADDVLTTGSTLGGAASALLDAGARAVSGACAARAW